MAGPITPEKLGAHPALQKFVEYIERHSGQPVDLSRLDVTAERPPIPKNPDTNFRNDGILEFNYFLNAEPELGVPNPAYYAYLDSSAQTLFLRHGWVSAKIINGQPVPKDQQWGLELPTPVQGACATVRDLGGELEAKADCTDTPMARDLAAATVNVLLTDAFLTFFKTKLVRTHGRFPLTRLAIKNLTPTGAQEISATNRTMQTLPAVLGVSAFLGSEVLLDQVMGWDRSIHRNERFAAGSLGGYGFYRGLSHWTKPASGKGITPMSFGAGLLTAGMVDALIGNNFAEGSANRDALRASAFFLPAIYRGVMGTRTLTLVANRPRLAAAGRVAAGVATVGFLTDLGMMGYHHFTEGEAGTARNNRLYQRAQELQYQKNNWFKNGWHRLLGMIMPNFNERNTSEEFVEIARQEMADTAQSLAANATQTLRHQLIFGTNGENRKLDFYQKVDWSDLREKNTLGVIKGSGARQDWYLDTVAKELADPKIRFDYLENKTPEQQIQFIQSRYRWNLSEEDVEEMLGRIALHHARDNLAQLHTYVTPEQNAWASLFDEGGKLKPGQEKNLLARLSVSTEEMLSEEQVLALRKVALLVQVLQLRENYRTIEANSQEPWSDTMAINTHDKLINRENLARQLGLIGPDGQFTPGEIGEQAMRVAISGGE